MRFKELFEKEYPGSPTRLTLDLLRKESSKDDVLKALKDFDIKTEYKYDPKMKELIIDFKNNRDLQKAIKITDKIK
jgi:hypothetical protein